MSRFERLISVRGRRGTASVEMAMVAPILILMLFGIIEFGLMFNSLMMLNNATREAARSAGVGSLPEEINARLDGAAGRLDRDELTVYLEFRTWMAYYWSEWTPIVADGSQNSAPSGSQIRVRTAYNYKLVVGNLFSRFADDPENNTKLLKASVIMRRE